MFISDAYSEIKFDGRYHVANGNFIVNELQMTFKKTFLCFNFLAFDFLCTFFPPFDFKIQIFMFEVVLWCRHTKNSLKAVFKIKC